MSHIIIIRLTEIIRIALFTHRIAINIIYLVVLLLQQHKMIQSMRFNLCVHTAPTFTAKCHFQQVSRQMRWRKIRATHKKKNSQHINVAKAFEWQQRQRSWSHVPRVKRVLRVLLNNFTQVKRKADSIHASGVRQPLGFVLRSFVNYLLASIDFGRHLVML